MEFRLSKKLLPTLLLSFGLLLASFLIVSAATFTENFSTTTYKDGTNTTADWNTTDGVLKLAKEAGGVAGYRSFANITSDGTYSYLAYAETEDCARYRSN